MSSGGGRGRGRNISEYRKVGQWSKVELGYRVYMSGATRGVTCGKAAVSRPVHTNVK